MIRNIFVLLVSLIIFSCSKKVNHLNHATGQALGTSYNITYITDQQIDYRPQFDSIFDVINKSMSTYITDSDISKLNSGEDIEIDNHFSTVFDASIEVYNNTKGVFDPTIGVLVNAWDFGPEGRIERLDSLKIDSLITSVGMNKIRRDGNKIIKNNQNTYVDFNAIAKGYTVDEVARFLDAKGIENYLVEIGGEMHTKGININKQKPWRVGIEDPNFDGSQSVHKAISLDGAMATSGTYRKFKIDENGNRYSHIIDTKTGYPSKTNVLSVSVIAPNCMLADAYATAFKAMGVEETTLLLEDHQELKAYFIIEGAQGDLETVSINGFPTE